MGSHRRITILNSNFWTSAGVSPSSGARLGAGVSLQLLPPLILFMVLLSGVIFSNSAYAAFSTSISRASSETISLGSIKPSYSGTLGIGSDVVTVSSNCSAGYNLYVSAIEGGSTNLNLYGTSTSEAPNVSNYIATTATATGSESALTKDTWGVGKDGSTFSKLPAYTADASTLTPLYTGIGSISNPDQEYTIYYGANVSTAKTPGTYTGDVLYTVLMNGACLEYTLKFDDNGATTSNLLDQTISFGQAVDLSEYSTTSKVSKTGYHLSGWKIKDGDGTLLPTNNNTSLDDGESSELTLVAEWEANTYTITYDGNGSTDGSTSNQENQAYDAKVTLRSNGFSRTDYEFLGWSISSAATVSSYSPDTEYDVSALAAAAGVTDANGGTITLYAVWELSKPCEVTASNPCVLADGNTWIIGNNGNAVTETEWAASMNAYCPSGYSIPTKDTFDNLLASYSDSSKLLASLKPNIIACSAGGFWSSTVSATASIISLTAFCSYMSDTTSNYYLLQYGHSGSYSGKAVINLLGVGTTYDSKNVPANVFVACYKNTSGKSSNPSYSI